MYLYLLLAVSCMYAAHAFKIAAFNVQIFGETKSHNKGVMERLARIMVRYDIVLIEEIRDSKQEAVDLLVQAINKISTSGDYESIVSPRLGKSSSKEQYGFLYRNDGNIKIGSPKPDEAKSDEFERPPFLVKFEVESTVIRSFVLGGVHTKPKAAVEEINAMPSVFSQAESEYKTDNIMIMGDFNAGCSYVTQKDWQDIPMKRDPKYTWLILDNADTTVHDTDCPYDRMVMTGKEFKDAVVPGSAKVFYFDKDQEEALKVSDHYPIEVELRTIAQSDDVHKEL